MIKYQWQPEKAMAFLPDLGGGANVPQVYCVNTGDADEKVRSIDDVIFDSGKRSLFQIVAFLDSDRTFIPHEIYLSTSKLSLKTV